MGQCQVQKSSYSRRNKKIGYVLGHLPAIEAWEASHPPRVDTRVGTALEA